MLGSSLTRVHIRLAPLLTGTILLAACSPVISMVPPGPPTEVEFSSSATNESIRLDVRAADGARSRCTTPCSLKIASGTAQVGVTSSRGYFERFPLIPFRNSPVKASVNTNRPWHWYLGLSMATLGVVSMAGTATTGLPAPDIVDEDGQLYYSNEVWSRFVVTASVGFATGLAFSLTGLALMVKNSRNNRVDVAAAPQLSPFVPLPVVQSDMVALPERVAIDATEVTVAAYERCVRAGRCSASASGTHCNSGRIGRGRHPINCIDLQQARDFCGQAGKRLPTEPEWLSAAERVPRMGHFQRHEIGWEPGTHRVASPPDVSGLHDLFGNVWEWVESRDDAVDVAMGGGWDTRWQGTDPSALRGPLAPNMRSPAVGVRCARDLDRGQP